MKNIVESMRKILELYRQLDVGLEKAPKGKIHQTQKLNKQKLLERFKGADEKLAGKAARNKHKIDEMIVELSRERELKNPSFFYIVHFNSFLQLTTIFEHQMKLLELQSKVEK